MDLWSYIIIAVAAYFLGSLPTGFLVAKAKGVDIRSVGSGNIGATNVFRILGKRAGIFVLVVDGLKGWVAGALLSEFVLEHFSSAKDLQTAEGLKIVAGICAILGHNYTCWLGFKGGKGIATTAGVLAALFPKVFLTALVTFAVVFGGTRFVSMGSLAAAISLPAAAWIFDYSRRMIIVAAVMGALAIYKHKGNIQRLLNGTENRVRFGKKPPEEPK